MTASYSLAERWLHWLALEPGLVRELSFDLERQFAMPPRAEVAEAASRAVYVCGLARSGTTLLLNLLDQVDDFRSLSYRNMPFPMAPNLWRRVTSLATRNSVAAPRPHGDGMLVDFDSPEGFEEVFWRTFCDYSTGGGVLSATAPSRDALAAFADYRALVANPRGQAAGSERRRYLSKNNNHLMRLEWLSQQADSTTVLLFRHPVAAARSMHATHIRFAEEQSRNGFMRRYMAWLCHYEFGLDHKPFAFAAGAMQQHLDPRQLDYWLDYWCAVHEHILGVRGRAVLLLDYDRLCSEPTPTLGSLLDALGVDRRHAEALASQVSRPRSINDEGVDRVLLERALVIHRALRDSPSPATAGLDA